MKAVATEEIVAQVADELLASGVEPTLANVQERTGGSYTTVKKHLETWEKQRHQREHDVELPAEVLKRGTVFVRELYALATHEVKSVAAVEIAAAQSITHTLRKTLDGAEAEVRRLEAVEQEQATAAEQLHQRVHDLEMQVASDAATIKARDERIDQITAELAGVREQLRQSEQEAATLRAQLADGNVIAGVESALADVRKQLSEVAQGTRPANA